MSEFLSATLIIMLAEMGDKTQLVALAFATRYSARSTLVGITVATLLVHLFSVTIGELLGMALPTYWISIGAGFAFIGFGIWTLRGDSFNEEEEDTPRFGPILTVGIAFFLAELGDKTMLATVTLAGQYHAFIPVWLGSTLGMVIADGAAIILGVVAGKRIPERAIKIAAAAIFIGFGIWSLGSTVLGARG